VIPMSSPQITKMFGFSAMAASVGKRSRDYRIARYQTKPADIVQTRRTEHSRYVSGLSKRGLPQRPGSSGPS